MRRRFLVCLMVLGICCLYLPSVWGQTILSWEDCLREAARNHPDLIAAQETVIQSQEQKAITAGGQLPQVSSSVSAAMTQSGKTGAGNSFDYGVTGEQLLFDGNKTANNVRAATENMKAARAGFRFTSATVRFRLRQAYINLLKAQESLTLMQEILRIRQNNFDLIQLRYQSGTEHKGALLTAQANVAAADFDVKQARRDLETAQRQLNKELGRREFVPLVVSGKLVVASQMKDRPDFDALVQVNPSLLKITAEKNAAAFSAKASQGEFWPTATLSGGVSTADSDWPPTARSTSAGIRLSWPLFEGGARLARINQAQSLYRQKQAEEQSTKDGVILSLVQEWNNLEDAIENVTVQESFLLATEERSRIAEQQYSLGLISFDNWTIISDDLVRTKKTFLDAQANAMLAEATWIQTKGEILEYEK